MKYYLLKTQSYFYDGHGTPDDGGVTKTIVNEKQATGVTTDGDYIDFDSYYAYLYALGEDNFESNLEYFLMPEDWDEIVEPYESDGYNRVEFVFNFTEITLEQVIDFEKIIEKYNNL